MNWIACVLVALVGAAGVLAMVLGLALLLAPHATLRLLVRQAPVTRLLQWADERRIERFVYRHHRLFGAVITLGALYSSYRLMNHAAPAVMPGPLADLILLGAVRFLWTTNTAIIIVGLVIFIRPSLLKGMEAWANRWVVIRPPALRQPSARVADLFQAAPRTAGMILAITGSYLASLALIHVN